LEAEKEAKEGGFGRPMETYLGDLGVQWKHIIGNFATNEQN